MLSIFDNIIPLPTPVFSTYKYCEICQKNWFTKKYHCPRCGAPIE